MSRTQIADSRIIMSEAEADALFAEIAITEAKIKASAAETDKKIAELKEKHETRTGALKNSHALAVARLTAYINSNLDRFAKPRQRKTVFGSYGLRKSTRLEIADEKALYAYAIESQKPFITVTTTINKSKITAALKAGESVPGASLESGEIAGYNVDLPAATAEAEAR